MTTPETLTQDDFLRGEPERLIQATEHPKILVVWPHGNEELGPRLGHRLYTDRRDLLPHVDYLCGNPIAASQTPPARDTLHVNVPGYAQGTDLNRSFSPDISPKSYEEHRAVEIMNLITEKQYDYVLDLHTSKSPVGACLIISERYMAEQAVRQILAASRIRNIVVLPDYLTIPGSDEMEALATQSLIGNCPRAVSVEFHHEPPEEGVEECLLMLDGLVRGKPLVRSRKRKFFPVDTAIPKDTDLREDTPNFRRTKLGYPILYSGRGTYKADSRKRYAGFAASTYTEESI